MGDKEKGSRDLPEELGPLGTLIDLTRMQQILDSFCDAAGVAAAIIDLEGKVLVGARWQPVCTDFHRVNERTCRRCFESDTELALQLQKGRRFAIYRCRNGLTDAAAPIAIRGRQVANAFVGQFFMEPPDEASFRAMASEYGFEQQAYLEAVRLVPVVSEAKVTAILSFLTNFAELVASMGLERLLQQETEQALQRRNRELHVQREAATSLAEDAAKARLAAEESRENLRESEQRFREIFNNMSNGVAIYEAVGDGEDFVFKDINPAGTRHSMLGRDAMIGSRVSEVFPGVKSFGLFSIFQEVWRSGVPQHYPVGRYEDERFVQWVENYVCKLPTGEIAVIYDDVSERKRASMELEDRARHIRSIFRAAPVGIGVVVDRVFTEMNTRFCEMLGYSNEGLAGRSTRMLYASNEEYERVGREKYSQIRERGTGTVETQFQRKDGTMIDVILSSTPLDPDDWSKGVTFTALDISERKRAEEEKLRLEGQLRQSQKMEAIGQLAGGVAHDFNNLLQVINGHTDMVIEDLPPDSPVRDDLIEVAKAGERAARLVSQLLAFSRRQVMNSECLDLNGLVSELLTMLRRMIGEHIELDFVPATRTGAVHADRSMMEQLLMNLCVNARDAMAAGGRLTIATKSADLDEAYCRAHQWARPGHYICLCVTDTGMGMTPEVREHIFEPFYTTKEHGKGTGLGLATVYGIVQQHGGIIHVYSEPGQGSTFRIYLPRAGRQGIRAEVKSEEPVLGGTETILLAEDDETVRNFALRLLRRAGYRVLAASNGEEALDLFQRHQTEIALLLLDVVMPKLGGRAVYDEVRRLGSPVPIVFASGYSENAIHTNFVLDEGLELVQKPYARDVLLRSVRRALGQQVG